MSLPAPGWVPVRLRIANDSTGRVDWRWLGDVALAEPFFQQTIAKLGPPSDAHPAMGTGLQTLPQIEAAAAPACFIFHISRCGSTLLANLFRALPDTEVFSEPGPLAAICGHFNRNASCASGALLGLMAAYSRIRGHSRARVIVKFSSWHIVFIQAIRRLWPSVPCLICTRDPLEVMVSCLREPPGWLRLKSNSRQAARLLGWDSEQVAGMSSQEYCARVLGEFLRKAREARDAGCHVLAYGNLNDSWIGEASTYSAIDLRRDNPSVARVLGTYSKDPAGASKFAPDSDRKRAAADSVARSCAATWAMPAYGALRSGARPHS